MSQSEHSIGHGSYVKIPIKISNCKVPYNEPRLAATSPCGFREEGWNVKKKRLQTSIVEMLVSASTSISNTGRSQNYRYLKTLVLPILQIQEDNGKY